MFLQNVTCGKKHIILGHNKTSCITLIRVHKVCFSYRISHSTPDNRDEQTVFPCELTVFAFAFCLNSSYSIKAPLTLTVNLSLNIKTNKIGFINVINTTRM